MLVYLIWYDNLDDAKQRILKKYSQDSLYTYTLGYKNSGEPILISDNAPKKFVSISHTDGILAMAFSDVKVGIDIERVDRKVSQKVCDSIDSWTKIEAYAKWTGRGLTKALIEQQIPQELIQTRQIGEYIVSVCGEDKKLLFDTLV